MRVRLITPVVCVVTRARGSGGSPERERLLERLGTAAAAGASMIQIRERHLDDRQLQQFVEEVKTAVRPETAVLVNDRTDIALAAGASGVHLKSDAPPVADVRSLVPAGFIVGRSVHGVEEALAAERDGADYLVFGTVFRSASKQEGHPVAGLGALAEVCHSVSLPVLAIGGIAVARGADVRAAGAAGIAAISLFANAPDVRDTVHAMRSALDMSSRTN